MSRTQRQVQQETRDGDGVSMTNRHKERENVWVVVRYDRDMHDPEHAFTVKEIVRDREIAEAEVDRLNRTNADKDCRYWIAMGRLFPESKSAGAERTD